MAKTGSPPRYKTKEDMQEKIDEYFTACEGHVLMGADGQPLYDKNGRPIITGQKPPTITGLALALDTTRDVLMDYEGKDGFSNTIKKAKLRIENAYEKRLIARGNGGDIFALKQFGWKDRTEQAVELSGNMSLESKLRALDGDKF